MKKLISLILVSALLFSLSFTIFAASNDGSSKENAVIFTADSFNMASLAKGKTLWYCYDKASLADEGIFNQILSANCSYEYSINIEGVSTDPDENGFVNVEIEDEDQDGKYYFSITNKATRKISVFISFESVKQYERTYVSLTTGDNLLSFDVAAPTAVYDFCLADFDGEAGSYAFTVKDTDGNVIESALLGDWGSIGAPSDMTGDA